MMLLRVQDIKMFLLVGYLLWMPPTESCDPNQTTSHPSPTLQRAAYERRYAMAADKPKAPQDIVGDF